MDSARVWLFHWIPPESSGLAWQKKSGQIPQTLLEYAGFQWTPLDSSWNKKANLALVTPGFESGRFQEFLAEKVGSVQSLAHTLITLQNGNHTSVDSHSIKNHVRAIVNLYSSSDEEKQDEQNQLEDDVEEVDELDNNTNDSGEFMQQ